MKNTVLRNLVADANSIERLSELHRSASPTQKRLIKDKITQIALQQGYVLNTLSMSAFKTYTPETDCNTLGQIEGKKGGKIPQGTYMYYVLAKEDRGSTAKVLLKRI